VSLVCAMGSELFVIVPLGSALVNPMLTNKTKPMRTMIQL